MQLPLLGFLLDMSDYLPLLEHTRQSTALNNIDFHLVYMVTLFVPGT